MAKNTLKFIPTKVGIYLFPTLVGLICGFRIIIFVPVSFAVVAKIKT